MVGGGSLFWGSPLEIFGWVMTGLLAILVLVFICIIVIRRKATILDTSRITGTNQQQDESHTVEGSLDRENEEERKE